WLALLLPARRIRIARAQAQREPLVGFLQVLRQAAVILMQTREIELAVGGPALGGLPEPAGRRRVIGLVFAAAYAQDAQVVHGPDVALVGGAAVPDFRPLPIGFDADAALEIGCQAELRRRQPARGRPLVQGKGALGV